MHRIALDYTPALKQTGGIGRYARELTGALASIDSSNAYRLFAAGAKSAELPELPGENFSLENDPRQQQVARAALASRRHSASNRDDSPVTSTYITRPILYCRQRARNAYPVDRA